MKDTHSFTSPINGGIDESKVLKKCNTRKKKSAGSILPTLLLGAV